jgi:two-component system chemotaxis response regulator CheB
MPSGRYAAIVMGTSAGGLHALLELLSALPVDYSLPLIIVQHRSKSEDTLLEEILQKKSLLNVKQADEKEIIKPGTVYIAPPDYHLMVETNETFSLSSDEPVHFSRPSIDVLFRSAAEVYNKALIGIILTGANEDGADGLKAIHEQGGYTIAQEPSDAAYGVMPRAAIRTGVVDKVLSLTEIIAFLISTR